MQKLSRTLSDKPCSWNRSTWSFSGQLSGHLCGKIGFHSFIQLNTGRVGNSIIRRYTQTEQKPFGCVPEEPQENQFYSDDDSRSDFGTMSEISHFTTQSRDVHLDDVEPDIQEMIDFKAPVYLTKVTFSAVILLFFFSRTLIDSSDLIFAT